MSITKPHLFISHATWRVNENLRTIRIRQRLFELLGSEWNVFVDKERLKPGDKWRPAILNSLANAQAGIILFDKTAIEDSDWVKDEALIMCFRHSVDPDFQLIPVLLDDLKPENEKFKVYQRFQIGEITFSRDDCQKTVEETCREIVSNLKAENAKTVKNFSGWMYEFEGLLFHMDQSTLRKAWESLINENSEITINDISELRRAVVQLVHHSQPIETLPALKDLRRELTDEQVRRIKNLIKQKWIENESVEVVFHSMRKRDKVLLIYQIPEGISISLELADCLFARLLSECPSDRNIKRITVADSTDTTHDEAVRLHIEKTIRENLGSKAYASDSEQYKRIVKTNLSDPQKLIICYIPSAIANSEVLRDLRLIYPEIVFLVQIGNDEDKTEFESSGGKNLTPILDYDKIDQYITLSDSLELNFSN